MKLKVLFNSLSKLTKLKICLSLLNVKVLQKLNDIIVNSLQELAINCKLLKKIDLQL